MASSVISGRLERRVALLPVARAQLIRLQRIEHAQDLIRAAADVEIGDVDEANHALRIDDVRRPLRDPGFRIKDAERLRELALDVGEHREGQIAQLLFVLAPGEVNELAVDAHAEQLRVARLEFQVELAERGNFRRTDEGEILRPEKYDLPLAREAVVRERLQALGEVVRDDAGEGISREFLTNAQHVSISVARRHTTPRGLRRASWRVRAHWSNRLI